MSFVSPLYALVRQELRIRRLRVLDFFHDVRVRARITRRLIWGSERALHRSPRKSTCPRATAVLTPMFWSPGPNMGDALNPYIAARVLGATPVYVSRRFHGKLLAVGSIIEFTQPNDVVVGAGAIVDRIIDARGARILATRGPLTERLIRNADLPGIYGDLALLLPDVYQPRLAAHGKIAVVPHYVDREVMVIQDPAVVTIDVEAPDIFSQIDLIAGAEAVVSSSLHGIVIAEAYGVPAVWVQPSQNVIGEGFKFRDHFAATDREAVPAAWSPDLRFLSGQVLEKPKIDLGPLRSAVQSFRAAFPLRVVDAEHPG